MPGLVEVAAGMGLTGGIVDDGIDDDDDEKRNTVSFLVLHDLHFQHACCLGTYW
jgi:hypothetical protein